MDGPTDGPTDRWTDGQTDGPTKRGIESRSTRLKIDKKIGEIQKLDQISDQMAPTAFFQVRAFRNDR